MILIRSNYKTVELYPYCIFPSTLHSEGTILKVLLLHTTLACFSTFFQFILAMSLILLTTHFLVH